MVAKQPAILRDIARCCSSHPFRWSKGSDETPAVRVARVRQSSEFDCSQGCSHGWKVEGYQGLGPNTGALAPRSRVLGAGGGRPPLWGSGGITPENFLKSQMLNLAFWWLLAVKFLAFWKLWPRIGAIHCWFPNLKVGRTSLPRSLWLLHLWL